LVSILRLDPTQFESALIKANLIAQASCVISKLFDIPVFDHPYSSIVSPWYVSGLKKRGSAMMPNRVLVEWFDIGNIWQFRSQLNTACYVETTTDYTDMSIFNGEYYHLRYFQVSCLYTYGQMLLELGIDDNLWLEMEVMRGYPSAVSYPVKWDSDSDAGKEIYEEQARIIANKAEPRLENMDGAPIAPKIVSVVVIRQRADRLGSL
jgi:hypothetical protein